MLKLVSHAALLYLSPGAVSFLTTHLFVGLAPHADQILALVIAFLLMPLVRPLFE